MRGHNHEMKHPRRTAHRARAVLRWILTGRTHGRAEVAALLRWHAGPDAEHDREQAGRPTPGA